MIRSFIILMEFFVLKGFTLGRQCGFFQNLIDLCLDTFILNTSFVIMKINNYQSDLSDVSATTATLLAGLCPIGVLSIARFDFWGATLYTIGACAVTFYTGCAG